MLFAFKTPETPNMTFNYRCTDMAAITAGFLANP